MSPGCVIQNGVPTISCLGFVFANVVRTLLGLAGLGFFILLLVGGFKYITAGGDPKAIDSAQKTLTYAVIGLVVILLSFLILVLIRTITGVDVTQFKVTL